MMNPGQNRRDILVVDDEPEIRDVLREKLCESYTCATAKSAEEALSILRMEEFDLVISDIRMGGMSGLEMIPHVLKSAPDTVIMMISGEQTIDSAIKALRLGAFDYITKPFDLEHVQAAVERALDHHSLLVTKRRYENHLEELVTQRTAERDHLAYHDSLTDLPNRTLFEDRLTQAVTVAQRTGQANAGRCLSLLLSRQRNRSQGRLRSRR